MNDKPEQEALFEIEGPDEDGWVWVCATKGRGDWRQKLGPKDKVVDAMLQWLRSIGHYPSTGFWAPLFNKET